MSSGLKACRVASRSSFMAATGGARPDDWSHYAAGARARGWAVALPGYVLAPEVRISRITADIARAIALAASEVAGPIRLSGHSAGGHLVARQICDDSALPAEVLPASSACFRSAACSDLRPLLRIQRNADFFRLDAAEAAAESPALRMPWRSARVRVWVGGGERPEFVRQSALIANVWTGLGADIARRSNRSDHFTIIDPLPIPARPSSRPSSGTDDGAVGARAPETMRCAGAGMVSTGRSGQCPTGSGPESVNFF